jgi:hypothetical protein
MSPEWAGAVFYVPSTSAANGIWTVGYDSSNYWTFYRWTSNGSDQRGGIRLLVTYPDNITAMSGVYVMIRTSSATSGTSHVDVTAGNPASMTSVLSNVAQTSWGIETISSSTLGSNTGTQERSLIQFDCSADDGAYCDIGPIWYTLS